MRVESPRLRSLDQVAHEKAGPVYKVDVKRLSSRALAMILGVMLSATPLRAHHSFSAEYDAKKPTTLTGTVTKIEWTNPHVRFYIDVKDQAGAVTNWEFTMGAVNGLLRRGWAMNLLKPGDA